MGHQVRDPAAARRERVRAMMRDDILGAARRLLQEGGIRALGMRALAGAVGVTAPTLYDYFPSKEAVLDALYVEGTERLRAAFDVATVASRPGLDCLWALAHAYRRFGLESPDLYRLIFGRVDAAYTPGEEEIARAVACFEVLVQVVREASERGEVRRGDAEEMARVAWTVAHGFVSLEIGGFVEAGSAAEAEARYVRTLGYLLDGLRPGTADGLRGG